MVFGAFNLFLFCMWLNQQSKDALNKRILLEFRYLKKKNNKLDKILRECKNEYKSLSTDYKKLVNQLEELSVHNT